MTSAAFVDIDGTLTRHGVAHRIGKEAFEEADGFSKIYAGAKAMQVMAGSPILGEDWGLRTFIQSLAKVGVTKSDMERYCSVVLDKHLRYQAIPYLKDISKTHDLWLLTTGCDIGPKIIENKYDVPIKGYMANKLVYFQDKLIDCVVRYREENIAIHVGKKAAKYDDFFVIDDRPDRYSDCKVYSSLDEYAYKERADF